MEHIFDDSSLDAKALGILLWCQYREKFTFFDIQARFQELTDDEDLLDLITFFVATKGYFEVVGDHEYVFVGERKKEKVLTAIESKFDAFRTEYRKVTGNAVPGLETALKLLKKHKDWRIVVDNLLTALYRESEYKEHLRNTGKFCPPWPNFQTWMNQRRWENEFDIPAPKDEVWKDKALLIGYKEAIWPMEMPKNALTEAQFYMWAKQIGPFSGIAQHVSAQRRAQIFISAHDMLMNNPKEIERAGGLYAYLVQLCKQ